MNRLYFRQVLAGRDTARGDGVARQMVNFQYLIGDRETGEAVVVDPAYDVAGLVQLAGEDGMLYARDGFNIIATANTRDRGVNEMSAALKRRFDFETVFPILDFDHELSQIGRAHV